MDAFKSATNNLNKGKYYEAIKLHISFEISY